MNIPILRIIDYPSSDGKPMAETPTHMHAMITLIEDLNDWYADVRRVYVWGNMFLYYVEGDPRKSVSPDVMVVKGVAKNKDRDVFKVWEEKRSPSLAVEITSRKTKKEDLVDKFELYRDVLKVKEYFLFDPKAQYLKPPLQGYRLKAGDYLPIKEVAGRLPSKVLGLHLERQSRIVRLWNPLTKAWLPTRAEKMVEAQEHAAQERRQRERVEAENAQLRRELETLKQRQQG